MFVIYWCLFHPPQTYRSGRADTSQIHEKSRRLASATVFLFLLPYPLKVLFILSARSLFLDRKHFGTLFTDVLGVLPEFVLFPVGDPTLNEQITWFLIVENVSVAALHMLVERRKGPYLIVLKIDLVSPQCLNREMFAGHACIRWPNNRGRGTGWARGSNWTRRPMTGHRSHWG